MRRHEELTAHESLQDVALALLALHGRLKCRYDRLVKDVLEL